MHYGNVPFFSASFSDVFRSWWNIIIITTSYCWLKKQRNDETCWFIIVYPCFSDFLPCFFLNPRCVFSHISRPVNSKHLFPPPPRAVLKTKATLGGSATTSSFQMNLVVMTGVVPHINENTYIISMYTSYDRNMIGLNVKSWGFHSKNSVWILWETRM